jgi:hypothetical protein
MLSYAQEVIGTVMTAILGILWFDLRQIRNDRGKLEEKIMGKVGTRIDDKDGGLVTMNKHIDLCRINTLEQNEELIEKFGEMLDKKFAQNGFHVRD